ncbi:MAG: Type-1 restriction enzyme MjaXIP specificity protein [Methanosaeta sp. PtaU1.Bin060]|jgi:type I restriction enzyme S subunit|nr:MAG: Type-1 restriction enzyme MjaXIP specificity protein [Methanosaeta sp. PtaU1.Bin060]
MEIDFPADWELLPLEKCMSSIIDYRGKSPRKTTFGIPLITAKIVKNGQILEPNEFIAPEDYDEWMRRGLPQPGDVIMTTEAPLGEIAQLDNRKVALAQRLITLRGKPKLLDNNYLKFVMMSEFVQAKLMARATGTTVLGIRQSELRKIELPIPPLYEQRAIARILGSLDDKIEANRRMNETLEAMARAIFKSWFVDFDPVRAKAEGREPAGMDAETAALFPDSFEETELGMVPRGWEVGSVYEIADVIYGAPFSSAQFNTEGNGEPLIRIRDLANELTGVWTPEVHPKGYKVRPGDIVVGMDGEFRAYLWGGVEGWLNQRICVFKPKLGWSSVFVRNAIIEPLLHLEMTETATTVIHLGKADIDLFKVVLPHQSISDLFNRKCQPLYDRIVCFKQESRTLAALRDALLPKLISGKLRVNDAWKAVMRKS